MIYCPLNTPGRIVAVTRTSWIKLSGALLIAGSLAFLTLILALIPALIFALFSSGGFEFLVGVAILGLVFGPVATAFGWLGVYALFRLKIGRFKKLMILINSILSLLTARVWLVSLMTHGGLSEYYWFYAFEFFFVRNLFRMGMGSDFRGNPRLWKRGWVWAGLGIGLILLSGLLRAPLGSVVLVLLSIGIVFLPDIIQAMIGFRLMRGRYDEEVAEPPS
jgi:hypothetical protein